MQKHLTLTSISLNLLLNRDVSLLTKELLIVNIIKPVNKHKSGAAFHRMT